jgi:hypothetical protein
MEAAENTQKNAAQFFNFVRFMSENSWMLAANYILSFSYRTCSYRTCANSAGAKDAIDSLHGLHDWILSTIRLF